ncbi:TPA: conserved phage C-terminal domain-containing protein [Streptococcus agalactiae]|uniref:Replication protein n=1 Tax=Streptococcus agalactiae TaxID=1311 RepID=A0AAW3HTV5_STRAG|nr:MULTISPECIES: conserved phage C-terminal domain-containing protein [Streptococcus]AIF86107.1 replication protein [Streptococcus agalactiae]AIF88222.1 replication protein [Streptococcus agalactiae]AQY25942.1 replication protein [Streptococcus agalactiae]AYZ22877.1 replication protein [Streptococcus agalactiae]EMA8753695.1 conserved phage C-terminal domain-containing protein [Streptococcus agalactiae]
MGKEKTKIYFWLKFDKKFFENIFIKRLKKMAGGDTMTVLYIRLMLESLETDCILYYEGYFDNLVEELAIKLEVSEDDINMTLAYFTKCGLIQIDGSGNAQMPQAKAMLESETNWAKYKRETRKIGQIPTDVQPMSNQCPTEIEIDIEKKKDKERELDKEKEYIVEQSPTEYLFPDWLEEKYVEQVKKGNPKNFDYRIPIAYLNQKMNSNYKFVKTNTDLVKARLKDSYTLEDFKAVIDKKCSEWVNSDMEKYLRPSTLFNASKFESYLNQPEVAKSDYYQKQQGQRFSQAELDELKKPDPKYGF